MTMTMRALRCRVGLHDWHPGYTQQGEQRHSCTLCGKERMERIKPIPLDDHAPEDLRFPGRPG
jgi:hypothetical protein